MKRLTIVGRLSTLDICGGTYYALTRVIIKGVGEHLENICRKMDGVYDNKWGMIFKN